MQNRTTNRELYGTKQVAAILGIPEWRVKNFTEGEAYRLPLPLQVGSGHGSRRLYGWGDIFRIGLADRLVSCGFTPDAVGQAIREIPDSMLAPYGAMLRGTGKEKLSKNETPILVRLGAGWRVMTAGEIGKVFKQETQHQGNSSGLFVLNLANACDRIFRQLEQHWSQ